MAASTSGRRSSCRVGTPVRFPASSRWPGTPGSSRPSPPGGPPGDGPAPTAAGVSVGDGRRTSVMRPWLAGVGGAPLARPPRGGPAPGLLPAAEAAPDARTTTAHGGTGPPMPFVPEAVVGQGVILAMLAYAGG